MISLLIPNFYVLLEDGDLLSDERDSLLLVDRDPLLLDDWNL